jgi:flagellar motor switch protein FliM
MGQALDDFADPQGASPRQSRWLRTVHESLARDFGPALSTLLRTAVDVRLAGIDPCTYGEFLDQLDRLPCLYVLKAAALEERLMLEIEPSILDPMIDRLLGGGGNVEPCEMSPGSISKGESPVCADLKIGAVAPGRSPSEIEVRLTTRIVRLFLTELHRAWNDVFDLQLDISQRESNPRALRVLPADEMVLLVGFELTIGQLVGMIRLCIPCRAIELIDHRPSPGARPGRQIDRATVPAAQVPPSAVTPPSVEVQVTLAESQIAAEQLADLRPGDIITTETPVGSPAVVSIQGDAKKFHARPGVYQGRKAVCITDPVEEKTDS